MKPLTLLLAVVLGLWAVDADGRPLTVKISGDRLSVRADRAPLLEILRQVAAQGIAVRIAPGINPEITADFQDRDLQKGLEVLIRPYSHALIWEAVPGPLAAAHRLAEIQVYEAGKKERMQPIGNGSALKIVVDPDNGSLYVADEILLRPGPGMDMAGLRRLLDAIHGRVTGGHGGAGVYRVRLPEGTDVPALVARLSKMPGVVRVEPNHAYRIEPPAVDFRLSFQAPAAAAGRTASGGVAVAVLDTGLREDSGLDDLVAASLDVMAPDRPIADDLGHGTQMALIASGAVRPLGAGPDTGARNPIIPIRVFDDNGYTSNFNVMKSIDFALKSGGRVMSLSWGSEVRSDFLETVFDAAAKAGLIIIASAGNLPTGKPVYPAAYGSVVGVGALSPDGRVWENSNHGAFVNVWAPGFAHLPVGYKGEPGTYAGTSIATAHTAAMMAQHLSGHPDASLEEIFEALGSP